MEIGSTWKKWDLHVHTPASYEQNFVFKDEAECKKFKGKIWDKFVDELEKVIDVPVIGITDYYSIEGYKRIRDYQDKGRLGNYKLILPNIEFRANILVNKNNSRKKINFHIIFSDELSIEVIEQEFLESINISTPEGEPRRLNKFNIEQIGKDLRAKHEKFKESSDFFVGSINIYVDINEAIKILELKKSVFEGKYIIVISEDLLSELGWDGQDHLLRKQLFFKCNALFSSNPNTIDWALGKKDNYQKFIDEFGRPKACIHGSDAHNFERLCKPDLDRHCWIKADCSFEGLKQIIYEPSERVKISDINPQFRKSIYTLSNIKVSETLIDEKLTIDEINLPINSNLVTIIGGKGTGKTALLDLIANCFIDQCYRQNPEKKRKNSFIQRIEDVAKGMIHRINFLDPDVGEFTKTLFETEFFEKSKISYLPQGQIEEFCGDEDKLEEKILEIIFGNRDVYDSILLSEYHKLTEIIIKKELEIGSLNLEIYSLEKGTSDEILAEIKKLKFLAEGELENKKKQLKKFLEQHNLEEKGEVSNLREEENKLKIEHSNLIIVSSELDDLTRDLEFKINILNDRIKNSNNLLKQYLPSISIPSLKYKNQQDLISKARKAFDKQISEKLNEIKTKAVQISQLSGFEKEHSEILKEIAELSRKIDSYVQELKQINNKKQIIKEKEQFRRRKYKDIVKYLFNLKECYVKIISLFSKGKNEILNEIDFSPKISIKVEDYISRADDLFHGKKVRDDDLLLLENQIKNIVDNFDEIGENVDAYINFSLDYKERIKPSRTFEEFYNLIFTNPFKILTDVYYNEKPMDKLSIGQKGTVLLKLMLAEGDYPLLIDQPEENLDNNFIYNDLVKAIRDAKKKRQIILATHNANLVVNTDAEQIIIANYNNNKINYSSGALENKTIKEQVTSLLEGGEEAFKKREEKYGFSS